jgi:hypothetical protein
MASAIDETFQIQNPAINSRVSANGPIGHHAILAGKPDAHSLRAGVQSFTHLHDAGFDEFFVVFAHLGEELLAGHLSGFGARRCFDDNHDFHSTVLHLEFVLIAPTVAALIEGWSSGLIAIPATQLKIVSDKMPQ